MGVPGVAQAWAEPEKIERLTDLWTQGYPCPLIARLISREFQRRFTRNAIIGKAWRLGLPKRDGPTRLRNQTVAQERARKAERKRNPTAKPARVAAPFGHTAGVPKPPTLVCEPVHEPEGGNSMGYTLAERPDGGCTWVLNAKRDGQWLFCGAPARSRGGDARDYVVCDDHAYTTDDGPGMFNPRPPKSVRNMLKRVVGRYT